MDEQTTTVSLKRKVEELNVLETIGRTAQCCTDDRKTLKAVKTALKGRLARLKKSFFPLTVDDRRALERAAEDLVDATDKLYRAKNAEKIKVGMLRISETLDSLAAERKRCEEILAPPTASETVRDKVERAGRAIEEKVKMLGDKIEQGAEKLKKKINDLGSK